MTTLPPNASAGSVSYLPKGSATRTTSPKRAASSIPVARALPPSSAINDSSPAPPRELLTATSCPAPANSLAAVAPMFPEPMTPIFISAPPFASLCVETFGPGGSRRLGPQPRPLARARARVRDFKRAHAAVGDDLRPHEEGRVGAGEEEHRLGDLLRPAEALQRHLRTEVLLRLLREPRPPEDGRLDRPGADRVDADAAPDQVGRERPHEREERGLTRRVDARIRETDVRDDRRVEDDGGAVGEERQRPLDGEVGALEVDAHGPVEELLGRLFERRELCDAGVDEEHVHAAVPLPDGVEQPVDVGEARRVRAQRQDLAADLARGLGERARV